MLMREDKKHEKISIHAPRAGRDTRRWWRPSSGRYFNPRAPCGARPPMPSPESGWWRFQSTRPVRGATCRQTASDSLVGFQSTRPVRGATAVVMAGVFDFAISIHAPRAGRDRPGAGCTGRKTDFNPRAPCGARPRYDIANQATQQISIHAPRAGRDYFLNKSWLQKLHISIHAPRAGRDRLYYRAIARCGYFNPRAPCGARLDGFFYQCQSPEFQSTRPVRGATCLSPDPRPAHPISIHAPRAGRDCRVKSINHASVNFNPRAPCGARPPPQAKNNDQK